jgi:hypothetical protein
MRHPARPRVPRAAILASAALLFHAAACDRPGDAQAQSRDEVAATTAGTGTTAASSRPANASSGAVQGIDWKAVDAAMGRAGAEQPGNVRRYGMPRADLRVTAQGVAIKPSFALGSWVAMTPHGDGVMAMGDLVLLEEEVAPVLDALQAGGVEQTAIHHHLVRERPRVVYVHVHATGDPVKVAHTVRAALARTGTPPQPAATAAAPTGQGEPLGIDTAAITRALGHGGRVNGGVYQVSVPRAETIREDGMEVPASMGLATAINFQPTGGGKAAVTGDYVMLASEVNAVIRTLREHGIELVSLHNHALREEPRLFFGHFWANADAATLARGLRSALDRTNSRPAAR